MVKEKRILSYFIGWLVLGLIVCFVGITKTYAATTTTYENIGYLNDVTILYSLSDDPPYPIEIPRQGEYQLYNVEKIMVQIDNYTFSGGTTYNLELSLPMATLNNNMYSVIDENGNKCSIGIIDSAGSSYPNYSFNCTKTTNYLTLNIYNTDGSDILNAGIFRWNYIYLRKQLTTTDTSILENQQSQIIQGQEEIKDTIKDELNSCRDSKNLFPLPESQTLNGITYTKNSDGTFNIKGTSNGNAEFSVWKNYNEVNIDLLNHNYYFISDNIGINRNVIFQISTWNGSVGSATWVNTPYQAYGDGLLNTGYSNVGQLIRFTILIENGKSVDLQNVKLMLAESYTAVEWEPYGKEICNNKLDEQNETSKGILQTLKDLPSTIINFLGDLLKSLFIPKDGYFENWFNTLKIFFETKLGFLATPFTIIIDFINRYLDLNPSADIIINIPDITVPNFEEHKIISATTFNWSELLKSKESLNTLWQLYLSFIDVFLILNFINLCENKYNRIFGGDTTQYEYYTVEESYSINDNTGEATNHKLNERRTTRKKVV